MKLVVFAVCILLSIPLLSANLLICWKTTVIPLFFSLKTPDIFHLVSFSTPALPGYSNEWQESHPCWGLRGIFCRLLFVPYRFKIIFFPINNGQVSWNNNWIDKSSPQIKVYYIPFVLDDCRNFVAFE